MSDVCVKCRGSPRLADDTWCAGCSAWEVIERELCNRWPGPAGLRAIGNNLVLNAAREVRALRAFGAGLAAAPSGSSAGAPAAVKDQPAVKSEELPLPGLGAKARPDRDGGADSDYTYTEEYETEEEEAEAKESEGPAGHTAPCREAPEVPRAERTESGRRTEEIKREDAPEPRGRPEERRDRSRSRRRSSGDRERRVERAPVEGETALPNTEGPKKKRKRKNRNRGGRKHKRHHRLAADPYLPVHRKLPNSYLDARPELERRKDRRRHG